MVGEVSVRPAAPADAAGLAQAHVRAWQAAYGDVMPAEFLRTLSVDQRTSEWAEWLGLPPSADRRILSVLVDGAVAGFAVYGSTRDDDGVAPGELRALNVNPQHWSVGAGSALLTAAHEGLSAMGFDTATLWVVPSNARARTFYERHGWTLEGRERVEEIRGVPVPEIRYRAS